MDTQGTFIVRMDALNFLVDIDYRTITVTPALSSAKRMTHQQAVELAQSLHRRGHKLAVVATAAGDPVDQTSSPVSSAVAGAGPLTAAQYNSMPMAEINRRYKSNPKFRAEVNQLIARNEI